MDLQNPVVEVGKLGRMNDNLGNQQEQQAGGNERRKNMTAGRRSKRIAFTAFVCQMYSYKTISSLSILLTFLLWLEFLVFKLEFPGICKWCIYI